MNLHLQQKNQETAQKEKLLAKLIKLLPLKEKTETNPLAQSIENAILLSSIKQAKQEWINANLEFEFACDPESIDYYIYTIKACQTRYESLIRRAKKVDLQELY